MKLNCWDFKKCGRTPNGQKASELGVCPASTDIALDGIHGGMQAGRAGWSPGPCAAARCKAMRTRNKSPAGGVIFSNW